MVNMNEYILSKKHIILKTKAHDLESTIIVNPHLQTFDGTNKALNI